MADKLDGEIKIVEAQKRERDGGTAAAGDEEEKEVQTDQVPGAALVNGKAGQENAAEEADGPENGAADEDNEGGEEDDVKEKANTRAGSSAHKRSASVLSQISDKSSKRQRK